MKDIFVLLAQNKKVNGAVMGNMTRMFHIHGIVEVDH